MENELMVLKCEKCGAQVITFRESNCKECEYTCCNENMIRLIPNSVDASFEKHVPTYEIKSDTIVAKVNHVMEDEHYIEWLMHVTKDTHEIRYFEPGIDAQTEFKYVPNSKLYAYCNKHGLWENSVK